MYFLLLIPRIVCQYGFTKLHPIQCDAFMHILIVYLTTIYFTTNMYKLIRHLHNVVIEDLIYVFFYY